MGISVIIPFLFASSIAAQQQIFKNYTANDGLVSNSVRRIFQDSKGFLWIGTWEGLSRYDGNTFTNLTTANGLSHNMVNDFYETKDGNIYVALNNGAIDEIRDGSIMPSQSDKDIVVNRFLTTPWDYVIAVTDRYGIRNFTKGRLTKPTKKLAHYTYFSACLLSDSSFATTDSTSLRVFNRHMEELCNIQIARGIYSETKCYKDSQNRLWAISSYGIRLIDYDPSVNSLTSIPLPAPFKFLNKFFITDLYEDREGNMWFATTTGIIRLHTDGSHRIYTIQDGLSTNIIRTIFQDNEDNLWFGTSVGLSKLVTKMGITFFPVEGGVFQNNFNFLMFPYRKDHFLVGTAKGTKSFNKISGKFSPVFKKGEDDFFFKAVENVRPLTITGIQKTIQLNGPPFQPQKILRFSDPSPAKILYSDRDQNFFYADGQGLIYNSDKGIQRIFKNRPTMVLFDRNRFMWVGTWQNGLVRFRYEVANDHIKILETKVFLPGKGVRALYEDSKGVLWAGTRYHGLFSLKRNNNDKYDVINFNQENGLTSNFIKGIREDGRGNYWIVFFQGLDKLIFEHNKFRIFNFSSVTNFFTSVVGAETDENKSLWLATEEGIVKVEDQKLEEYAPRSVFITKIYSADTSYPLTGKKLLMNYQENDVQFEYSSPSFINEKQIFYSYRLKGNEQTGWSKPDTRHSVSYAALPPGSYQFEVKSLGWNGEWSKASVVSFEISPPFWQSWWFIFAGLLAVSTVIAWLIRRRVRNIRRESQFKRRIAETEMLALRAQMNPHFIFNCINSIDALIQANDKYHATVYLNKFAKLIRSILDSSKQNNVSLADDLETLKLYIELEQFRHEQKFSTNISVKDDILLDDYRIPPLIVQPFVENAIQHGLQYRPDNKGILSISITKTGEYLQYIIEDNGVGREGTIDHSMNGKMSYGISISSERVRLFNKEEVASVKIHDLYFENQPSGTRVEVRLNIQSC